MIYSFNDLTTENTHRARLTVKSAQLVDEETEVPHFKLGARDNNGLTVVKGSQIGLILLLGVEL